MLDSLLLFRLRRERAAVQQAVDDWRLKYASTWPGTPAGQVDWKMHAASLAAMAQACRLDHENDTRLFQQLLTSLEDAEDEKAMQDANTFVQEQCDRALAVISGVQGLSQTLHVASGLPAPADPEILEEVARGYWKWKEDFPELSLFHWKPTRNGLRKRIEKVLSSPRAEESDWREAITRYLPAEDAEVPSEGS
jgi:hypothetical protein